MQDRPYLSKQNEAFACRLLHQQCWCWGCDIRNASGNLLMRNGCLRHRPPAEGIGSSCYETNLDSAQRILVWGFGVAFLSHSGDGVFVHRNNFRPKLFSCPSSFPWTASELELSEPQNSVSWFRALNYLRRTTEWITEYETSVAQIMGPKYRKRCLRSFHELAQNHRSNPIEQWTFVTKELSSLLESDGMKA